MLADLLIAVAFLVVGLSIGPLVAVAPALAVVGAGGVLLVLLAVWRPVEAVAGYVLLNPLLVGLDRGAVVPFLRLNEVLLLPLLAGLFVVLLRRWARKGWAIAWRGDGMDVAVLALAFTGSVTTLVWNFARNREITADDLLYAVSLWKLVVLYAVVRLVVRDRLGPSRADRGDGVRLSRRRYRGAPGARRRSGHRRAVRSDPGRG